MGKHLKPIEKNLINYGEKINFKAKNFILNFNKNILWKLKLIKKDKNE